MSEGREMTANPEPVRQKLENYLSNAEVGTPKLMAFWDQVDLIYARDDERSNDPKAQTHGALRTALVQNRIDSRMSEIPGYGDASFDSSDLVSGVESEFSGEQGRRDYLDYLNDIRSSKIPTTR